MNILLTGASGFLGRNIAAELSRHGHQVVPVSRRHGLDFSALQTPQSWLQLLQGVDAVINAVGVIAERGSQGFDVLHTRTPVALFRACERAGVRRVIQISALGVDASAWSGYHRSKLAADEALRALNLEWFVLRPSLVYGASGTSSALLLRLARAPALLVPGQGEQRLQPIHVSDVVAAVMRCLQVDPARQTLDLVGPEVASLTAWLQCMRRAQGLPRGRVLHVPRAVVQAGFALGQWFTPLLHPDNLRMLQAGSVADVQPLARLLGRMPRAADSPLFFQDDPMHTHLNESGSLS